MKKSTDTVTVLLFLILVFGSALAFWILPDRDFSAEENRGLRTLPDFSLEALTSGAYSDAINEYYADQFPMRDAFVGWKGTVELLMGKGENNGILLGKNRQLARRAFDIRRADGSVSEDLDLPDPETLSAVADSIGRVHRTVEIPFTVMLTARPIDVAASAFSYPHDMGDAFIDRLYSALPSDLSCVDTLAMFREKYDAGEYVYYRTDHHWTTQGAYYAYAALMREWGMEDRIIPSDAFDKQTVSDAFYGTLWSAGGMKFVPPDSVEFWMLGNEDAFVVTADGKVLDGFYNREYLAKKDKYSAFLDGTHDVVTVTKNTQEDRPTLVLFKDSFANSLAPFLAQHFDLVLLNLSSTRTDYTDIGAYATQYNADRVLLIYTLENVMTADKLGSLR